MLFGSFFSRFCLHTGFEQLPDPMKNIRHRYYYIFLYIFFFTEDIW